MNNAKETIEAARSWHKLGLLVSAVALALLFAPSKANYKNALHEAYVLRDLRMSDYETFVRQVAASAFGNTKGQTLNNLRLLPDADSYLWSGKGNEYGMWAVAAFLGKTLKFSPPIEIASANGADWTVVEIVQAEQPPSQGTLSDWSNWVASEKPAQYFYPNWTSVGDARIHGRAVKRSFVLRHFSLRASLARRTPGEYTFRAFFEPTRSNQDGEAPHPGSEAQANWWAELDPLESDKLWDVAGKVSNEQLETRMIYMAEVPSHLRDYQVASGIKHWLQNRGLWSKVSRNDGFGEIVMPEMRLYWPELRERSLNEAVFFMEQKQKEIQDVTLLGIPVPGQLCVAAIPLAYLVIYLYLLLDVRYLRRIQTAAGVSDISASPWSALYNDWAAKWITAAAIVVVPPTLSALLLVKYFELVPSHVVIIAAIAILAGCAVEVLANRAVGLVRGELGRDTTAAESGKGGHR